MCKFKLTIIYSFLIIALYSCNSYKKVYFFTSFHEPANQGLRLLYSYDGYKWIDLNHIFLPPQVGNQQVMRDPSIIQDKNGIFHLVWTSSWRGDRGFGYSSSKDLINWTEQKFIPVMEFDTSTVNVWAPEIFFDDEKNEFIIIWASTLPYKFPNGIEDIRNNHRLYYTVTKDFINYSPAKLFFDPGYSVIDGTIVKMDKNKYVLVFKDNTRPQRNIKAAFSDKPLGVYDNITPAFTDTFTEGPSVLKINREYLIYYDAYRIKKYGASITKDFKSFRDISDKISIPEGHKHGTVFISNKKVLKNIMKAINSKTK
jgi:hypothetical protein